MAKLTAEARARARPPAAAATASISARRPPRAPVPAFGGWEVAGGLAAAAAVPDYSLDFTNIRAARMQRRKALSWSSFVGNAAVVAEAEAPGGAEGHDGHEEKRQWSSALASDGDDDDDDRERRRRRRLRSADIDDRQPIQPGRAAPKQGRSMFKGYLFGCVGGQW